MASIFRRVIGRTPVRGLRWEKAQLAACNGIGKGIYRMSSKADIAELMKEFGVTEQCTLEQLRLAHERAVEIHMGNAERIHDLDRKYLKLMHHKQKQAETSTERSFTHTRRIVSGKDEKKYVDAENNAFEYLKRKTKREDGDSFTESSVPGVAPDYIKDKIVQRALLKTDLSQAKGYGKPQPLITYDNPFVDNMQNKINNILINNNFSTEWIVLKNEVKKDIINARATLTRFRERLVKENKSVSKDNPSKEWRLGLLEFNQAILNINKKVDDINLTVPSLHLQQAHFNSDREIIKLEKLWEV